MKRRGLYYFAWFFFNAFVFTQTLEAGQPNSEISNVASVTHPILISKDWPEDNKQYATIQDKVDRQVAQGQSLNQLVQQYKEAAQPKPIQKLKPAWQRLAGNTPQDPVAVYGWGYTVEKAIILNHSFNEELFEEPFNAMLGLKNLSVNLRSQQFARLFFLVGSHAIHASGCDTARPQIIALGERLHQTCPQDEAVTYHLIKNLINPASPTDSAKALAYSQGWVHHKPVSADAHVSLAASYTVIWIITHKKDDANKAIKEYQTYLHLKPASDSSDDVQRQIEVIQHIIKSQ